MTTNNNKIGESQVSEEFMAKIADEMKAKNVSREDKGAVLVDFTQHLPGKAGKRLGTTVLRYVIVKRTHDRRVATNSTDGLVQKTRWHCAVLDS